MLTPTQLDEYAAIFTVLGRFHRVSPDAAALRAFHELLEEWPLSLTDESRRALELLGESANTDETASQIKTDLNILYGVSARAKVAPFESVHRDRDGLVFDKKTLQVRKAYRAVSLQIARLGKEPDDHVGFELDFLAQCCLGALGALEDPAGADYQAEEYFTAAATFMEDHAMAWIPQIMEKAAEQASTLFMRGLCLLTAASLEQFSHDLQAANGGHA